ncbi:MAG TPA: carboxylesterase family protein [Candidatus Binataceae bacterium]|nr:carboxylesterase family protein [Candidatus Binataceae bacterium]
MNRLEAKDAGFGISALICRLFLIVALFCSSRTAIASPVIVTDQGPLRGLMVSGEKQYLGIPYAAPPVGSLRWQPPQPPARFKGVFQATQFGQVCAQVALFPGNGPGSEDCLYLNVYVPTATPPPHGFPVMVWIHGGAFVVGGGGQYDPTPLVEKGNVIVVTINYRLGFLGFFAHPALDAEGHLNANYGLMDQQFALGWVRRNIGRFGGDHKRVTIFGESAGGESVYLQLASPLATGLFQGAISESGAFLLFQDYFHSIVDLKTAEEAGTAFATSIGCGDAQCLRKTPASTIVEAQPASGVAQIVDGTLLTQTLDSAFASGQLNRVPVISGSNHDEWRYFVALNEVLSGSHLMAADYPQAVYSFLSIPGPPSGNPFADFVISLYPLSADPTSPSIELGALGTDIAFACPGRNASLLLSAARVPTYAYEFNDKTAPSVFPPSFFPPLSFPTGDSHFVEVQYLFNLSALHITPTFTLDQQQLSNTMIGYWTQFATTGNPNFEGAPNWPAYTGAGGQFQSLVAPAPGQEPDATFDVAHKCSTFWNTF